MRSLVLNYLDEVYRELSGEKSGSVADYIPELAIVDPDSFGICLATSDGYVYEAGDTRKRFAIQSVSKPFTYALALADRGLAAVAAKIDVEPSGEPFNEISLDPVTERPRNPMINAGAITCASLIVGDSPDARFERLRSFYSRFAGRELDLDEDMYRSEDRTGSRNRAIGYMLRSFGILEEDPQTTLSVYFRQCSVEVDCRDLSMMAATLADSGLNPVTNERVLEPALTERVLSVMTTCGMYNAAGDWVTEVGLPAKSGVGGGILAVLPGQVGLAVFSPRLDERGNSIRGVRACRRLSKDLELHFMHVSRAARSAVRATYDVADAPSRRRRSPQEQAVLLQYGRRATVYELHGDLLFAGAESVIREVTRRADDLDVVVMDVRGVDEISAASRRLLLSLRDELRQSGCEQLLVDPTQTVLELDPDVGKRVAHFSDVNSAIEYAEDVLIARYGGVGVRPRSITVDEHPLLAGLLADEMSVLRSRLIPRSYADGDVVVSEGGGPEGLFLVLSGMIDVHIDQAGVRQHLSMFTVGTTFGVVYAVAQRDYDIDAHASGDVQALLLPVAALAELSRLSPDLMLALLRRLVAGAFDSLELMTRTLVTPN
ncbi:MAG: glutaminase A [Nakamurella sp.]